MASVLAAITQLVAIVASLAAVGALWVGVYQMIQQNKQRHREFENLYVQRYWSITDRFSLDYVPGSTAGTLSAQDRKSCCEYLALCEDEADLFERGRITQETWELWKEGIDHSLQEDVYRDLLESSSSEQYMTLRRYISEGRLVPKYQGAKAKLRGLD